MDRVRQVPRLPKRGEYIEVESERICLGGEAANTAVALASWHADVWLGGNEVRHGVDARILLDALQAAGVAAHPVGESAINVQTPVCDIYVTPDGERTLVGLGFKNMEPVLNPKLIPTAPKRWFTAEPNMSAVSRQAVRVAAAAKMNIYLMDFIRGDDPILPGSYWQSSTDWVGKRDEVFGNVERVKELVDGRGCFAILSDGPNGFVAGGPKHPVRSYPPFPSPKVVDTTGAGDVFRAGMLFGLDQEWPIEKSLQFAAAAGAISCRQMGATTEVPTLDEITELISDYPSIADCYH